MWVEMVVKQSGGVGIGYQGDRSTVSTVSPVRTAKWFELLALYGDATFSAITSAQVKGDLINK
jgi:hypothetical protein